VTAKTGCPHKDILASFEDIKDKRGEQAKNIFFWRN